MLFAVVILFVTRAMIIRFMELDWTALHFRLLDLVAALACMTLAAVCAAATFRPLVAAIATAPSWPAMCAITWIPRLGKYLPGKASSVVGTIWMLGKLGVGIPEATSALYLKSVIVTLMSLIVAAPITLWPQVRDKLPGSWLLCAGMIAGGFVCLHPRVFGPAGNFILRKPRKPPIEKLPLLGHYVLPVLASVGQWLAVGASLFFLTRSVTAVGMQSMVMLIPAASLASAMGFFAFFVPAGLGVQEGTLLIILTPLVGELAAVIVVLFRLSQTISDVAMALIGMALFPSSFLPRD